MKRIANLTKVWSFEGITGSWAGKQFYGPNDVVQDSQVRRIKNEDEEKDVRSRENGERGHGEDTERTKR